MRMVALPDEAIVVRGGRNLPENFARGSGVTTKKDGTLEAISVNGAADSSVKDLTAANSQTGYPGIPHRQVGVTTVGEIRAAGGDVEPSPRKSNPHHATLSVLTAEVASRLFQPTVKNPNATSKGAKQ